jgi:hypothetical protein
VKPSVHFKDYLFKPEVGRACVVFPTDHPAKDRVSNKKWAITSPVVAIQQDGSFETMNTRYVPLMDAGRIH